MCPEGVTERSDHPCRVGVAHAKSLVLVRDGIHGCLTLGRVLAGDRAKDGIDETDGAIRQVLSGDIDGGGNSSVVGHSHVEELVGAHTQDDKRARIEISKRAINVARDDPVKAANRAQRAVDELGGERCIPIRKVTVAPRLTQSLRQNDVRKRALSRDFVKNVVGDTTRLIGLA